MGSPSERPSRLVRVAEVIFGGIAIVTAGLGMIVAVVLGLLAGDLGVPSWPKTASKWVKVLTVFVVFAVLGLFGYLLAR